MNKHNQEMKYIWWLHYKNNIKNYPKGVTVKRLNKYQEMILNNENLWDDVLLRFSGNEIMPEAMNKTIYDNLISNMHGMIVEIFVKENVIRNQK